MTSSFSVSILTQDRVVFDGEAISMVVPAHRGFLGILAHHAPIVAKLTAGKITVKSAQTATPIVFESSGNGFLEVLNNKATLLLDSVVS